MSPSDAHHSSPAGAASSQTLFALREVEFRFAGKGSSADERRRADALRPSPADDGFRLAIRQLDIARGERLAIVGHNGSGKSTLLRLLARLEEPDRAKEFLRPEGASVGVLKQDPYLFDTDVAGNLAYPLRMRRTPAPQVRARVAAMLATIGLEAFPAHPARNLSGGERKRLALGRALISEPEILLLDEPDAFLDRHSQDVVEHILESAAATWVLTTHDLRFAHRVAKRIVALRDGRLASTLPVNTLTGEWRDGAVVTSGGLTIHPGETHADANANPNADANADVDADAHADAHTEGGMHASGRARLSLDPNDLVLSREAFDSSMRNSFGGRVRAVHEERGSIWVEIDAAGERLTAIVSRESYERLGLNVNQEIRVSFKAHAVEVL
ncbi:MAG: ATP-binding cassette domain-containing protein [Candidatus Eisenbacteria bacterium]|nr:ATP-binding cassette domain-containing protein [Candidatus Eisenbacteria bacterium]